jgi:hypothetical protein
MRRPFLCAVAAGVSSPHEALSQFEILLLTQAFRAPAGYQLDFALATTYSLDLGTLLASTLHLSVLGKTFA